MTQPWEAGNAPGDPYRPDFSTQPIPLRKGSPPEPPMVTIGDIVVTRSQVITPNGTRAVGEVQWAFTDVSRTTQAIPVWAIVLAVIGFFLVCILSLLFLLVKEWRTDGLIQVTVYAPGFSHTTSLPVSSPLQVGDYSARVSYAQSLSTAAGA